MNTVPKSVEIALVVLPLVFLAVGIWAGTLITRAEQREIERNMERVRREHEARRRMPAPRVVVVRDRHRP